MNYRNHGVGLCRENGLEYIFDFSGNHQWTSECEIRRHRAHNDVFLWKPKRKNNTTAHISFNTVSYDTCRTSNAGSYDVLAGTELLSTGSRVYRNYRKLVHFPAGTLFFRSILFRYPIPLIHHFDRNEKRFLVNFYRTVVHPRTRALLVYPFYRYNIKDRTTVIAKYNFRLKYSFTRI